MIAGVGVTIQGSLTSIVMSLDRLKMLFLDHHPALLIYAIESALFIWINLRLRYGNDKQKAARKMRRSGSLLWIRLQKDLRVYRCFPVCPGSVCGESWRQRVLKHRCQIFERPGHSWAYTKIQSVPHSLVSCSSLTVTANHTFALRRNIWVVVIISWGGGMHLPLMSPRALSSIIELITKIVNSARRI